MSVDALEGEAGGQTGEGPARPASDSECMQRDGMVSEPQTAKSHLRHAATGSEPAIAAAGGFRDVAYSSSVSEVKVDRSFLHGIAVGRFIDDHSEYARATAIGCMTPIVVGGPGTDWPNP